MKHRPPLVALYERRDSPWYWLRVTYSGERSFRCLRGLSPKSGDDRSRAEAIRRDLQDELLRRFWSGDNLSARVVTLADVLDCYRRKLDADGASEEHRRNTLFRIDRLLEDFGASTPADALTVACVNEWKASSRRAHAWSPTTIRNYLIVLRAGYRQARLEKLVSSIPWDGVKFPHAEGRDEVIPLAHLQAIVAGVRPENPADVAIMLAMFTGLRRRDLESLDWREVDFEAGVIRRTTHKARVSVSIPMAPELSAFLAMIRADAGPIFAPAQKDRSGLVLRRTAALCGTAHGLHRFRHTFVTSLAEAKVNPRVIQGLAGHLCAATTLGYTHPGEGEARDAVNLLPFRKPASPVEKEAPSNGTETEGVQPVDNK